MAALIKALLSAQFTLWKRLIKAQKTTLFQVILIPLYTVGAAVGLAFVLAFGENSPLVLVSSVGVLVLWMFQYTAPSPEHQIDLEKCIALPLDPRRIRPAMVAVEMIQSRGFVAILCSIITAIGGSIGLAGNGVAIVVYVLGIVVSFATAIVGTAAIRTLVSSGSERSRTMRGLGGVIVFLIAYFIVIANGDVTQLKLDQYLAWTPFGAAVAPTQYLVQGNPVLALLSALLALAYLAIAWWLLLKGLRRELSEISVSAGAASKSSSAQLLVPPLRFTAFGALLSRQLRYLKRDSRMVIVLTTMLIMITGFFVFGVISEGGMHWVAAYLVIMMPTQGANLFGYNGPANNTVMVTPTKPSLQLKAETMVFGMLSMLLAAGYLLALGVVESFDAVWLVVAVTVICGVVCSMMISAVLSAYNPYPTSKPGTAMMKDRSGQNSNAFIGSLVCLAGVVPLIGPGFALMLYAVNNDALGLGIGGALLSVVMSAVGYVVGTNAASKKADSSMPEIYSQVRNWV
ncbi:hypothetical protein [Corynebacterium pseudopelargi]|uniref:hypothetical protein n=1 Tax=Corynebacterium pseudopelargi TaxID=2080757 RepID=UPI0013DDAD4F|nr:hypothetical protein [Corynebacterium pseudopelargi]